MRKPLTSKCVTGRIGVFTVVEFRRAGASCAAANSPQESSMNIKTAWSVAIIVGAFAVWAAAQVWASTIPGVTNAGNLVTAGDVVFQGGGTGDFYAFDAKTGRQLFKHATGQRSLAGSPLTYAAGGKQFVAVVAGSTVFALALP